MSASVLIFILLAKQWTRTETRDRSRSVPLLSKVIPAILRDGV
jgi:hypothetical protein